MLLDDTIDIPILKIGRFVSETTPKPNCIMKEIFKKNADCKKVIFDIVPLLFHLFSFDTVR